MVPVLERNNLTAYDPRLATEKAEMGEVRRGFEFLGSDIRPGMISPARKSRQGIFDAVKNVLEMY